MELERVSIVIAAYEEEASIGEVLKDLRAHGYESIIVVDDGSKDDTARVARAAGATVLRHVINRGQGAALRTGINHAYDNGADVIVTYDADGQFCAEDIARVIEPIQRDEVDIVLGSRFLGQAINITPGKHLILKLGALVTFVFSGIYLTDSHNGFRALNRVAAHTIRITFDRMEHASEIVEEVAKHGLRHAEVPVTVVYHEEGQHPLRSLHMGIRLILRKVLRW